MEGSADAQRIGVELQNLLKIPPISKISGVPASKSVRILQRLERVSIVEDKPVQSASVSVEKVSKTDIKGAGDLVTTENVAGNKIRPWDYRDKKAGESGNASHPFKLSFAGSENKSSTVEDTSLLNTLRRSDCPRDLQLESEALLDYANKERSGGQMSSALKALLSRHHVDLLSKRSSKFPKAKFFCSHCNYHMDTIYACVTHIMGIRHTTFELMKKLEFTLLNIPDPSPDHCVSLGRFLVGVLNDFGIPDVEMERRKEYINRLNEELQSAGIGCTLSLYGSSFTSLGFKDSDINVNVVINEGISSSSTSGSKSSAVVAAENSDMLQKLFLFFQHHSGSAEVKKLVTSKSAKIHLRECGNFCEVILSMNNNAGVETARLFTEYGRLNSLVRLLTMGLRVWAKFCEIDNQDKGCLPPHSYAIMVIYYLQQKGLLPNLHLMRETSNSNSEEAEGRPFASAEDASAYWKKYTTASLGYHWLKMLRFYAVEFNYKESVISISHQNVLRAEKYWNRKISIEDPVISKSNLSRSMSNNRMCDYILERLKFTYLYFAIPRTIRGPLYDGIVPPENANACKLHIYHQVLKNPSSHAQQNNLEKITNPRWDPVSLTEEVKRVKWRGNVEFPKLLIGAVKFRIHQYIDNDHRDRIGIHIDDVAGIDDIFPEWLYDYKFDTQLLQNGLKPPIVCKSCGIEGHFRSDCPDEILPVLRPVMNATPSALRLLNDVLMKNYDKEALNSHDVDVRTKIVGELEGALLPIYPDAQLTMFGSTHNGFGVHMSDVDVCLTFRNKSALKLEEAAGDDETNAVVILRTIVERLKSAGFLQEVVAIPSAKVPIVKFRHRATSLEGDISLYNTLAMYNTKLLRTYAELDWRVKVIGCFLKKLTKLCDISDASRGSLSSYGYVLMAIHYFQHTSVPVLPVLQELCRDTLEPIIIDGCDVQYFKDLQSLKYVWPYYGKNRQSIGELWLGFLNYYTETFNFEEHVVTISQYNTLTRVYKFWLTDALAIEDPFDRTHNLGAGLSRRMSIHILKTFHHLRQVFHSAHDASALRKHKDWLSYFTDPKLLQNGNPPLDRQCRICHKIGHIARNCTQNEKGDEVNGGSQEETHTPTLREVIEQVQGMNRDRTRCQSKTGEDSESPVASEPEVCVEQRSKLVQDSRSNSLSQHEPSFPRFFGENNMPNAEDEAIFRMISGDKGARETPGVEFVLQNQVTAGNSQHFKYGNGPETLLNYNPIAMYPPMASPAFPFNGLPATYGDSNSVRLRGGFDPSMNPGVSFMGPPSFHAVSVQYMGNPNMSLPTAAPPPPGFAPLPNVPIVSHPTYIHPHVIPSHPFPVNLYPIPVHRAPSHPQHDGGGHPGPHHLHPFPAVFSTNVGPFLQQTRTESVSSIPNGDAPGQQNHHESPVLMNGYPSDADRVCLPTMTSLSPIMTSYPFPAHVAAQYPRINDN